MRIFEAKIVLCLRTFQFSDDNKEKQGIDLKTATLTELCRLVDRSRLPRNVIQRLFDMIEMNIFRPLSFDERILLQVDAPYLVDSAWPHLALIYDILTRLVSENSLPDSFFIPFFHKLLIPSSSPDSNERIAICNFIVAVVQRASHLRRSLIEIYEQALIDYRVHHCHSPFLVNTALAILLEIGECPSAQTMCHCILPLLAEENITVYANVMRSMLTRFMASRATHGVLVLDSLLKVFPIWNVSKQMYFLSLITAVLDQPISSSATLAAHLARTLILAGESQNEGVAQGGLRLWWNASVERLISDYLDFILPFVIPSLTKVMENHWSRTIRLCAKSALGLFQRRDKSIAQESVNGSGPAPALQKWILVTKAAHHNENMINLRDAVQQIFVAFKQDTPIKAAPAKAGSPPISPSNPAPIRS
jgi:hypothetical protein